MGGKIRLAVHKLASCDGCQLSLLDCEDELLAVAEAVELVYFLEATSRVEGGPYDVSLVEGSITTPHDASRLAQIREDSGVLVTIGACATSGGIQALRNGRDHDALMRMVYAHPEYIDTLATSTPVSDHVKVDFELRGCPISKHQLLEAVSALLNGRRPAVRSHSVCGACKARGTVCVTVARGEACAGPVTHAGCGALCPTYNRGCFGCFGPSDDAKPAALAAQLRARGVPGVAIHRLLANFNANAEPFRSEAAKHG